MRLRGYNSKRAFTLVETVIATAAASAVGIAIFATLNVSNILFAKNCAMNVSHEQAREALALLNHDLHNAVSIPEITDTSCTVLTGTGPAAGITFQQIVSGSNYCQVAANSALGSNQVSIWFPSSCPTPAVGQRLIIPAYEYEQDITAVSVSGSTAALTLSGTLATPLTVSQGSTSYNVCCFLTKRVYYVVQPAGNMSVNGVSTPVYSLNYYGPGASGTSVLAARNVMTQNPFSISSSSANSEYYQFAVSVNLSSDNSTYSNRNFAATNIVLNGQIPIYSQLTTYQ